MKSNYKSLENVSKYDMTLKLYIIIYNIIYSVLCGFIITNVLKNVELIKTHSCNKMFDTTGSVRAFQRSFKNYLIENRKCSVF